MLEFSIPVKVFLFSGEKVMTLNKSAQPVARLARRAAFTLMEMLVVVAIIVVLAGVGGSVLLGQLEKSKVDAARLQADVIGKAVQAYAIHHSGPPAQLSDLLTKDADGNGPYIERQDALLDPWGRPYQYDPNGANNARVGAVVTIPDVFCVPPSGGMPVGNWKEPKR
jgi:general secretion pathway protein G